jgi:hypothetical protein
MDRPGLTGKYGKGGTTPRPLLDQVYRCWTMGGCFPMTVTPVPCLTGRPASCRVLHLTGHDLFSLNVEMEGKVGILQLDPCSICIMTGAFMFFKLRISCKLEL